MEAEAWRRLEALVDQALDLGDADRNAFLDSLGRRDPELRRGLEAFLAADSESRGFLDDPVAEHAGALLRAIGDEQRSWDAVQLEGRSVGPYRVLRELGRGGMGAVFLAQRADGQFEQQVALKLVRRGLDGAEIVERFRAERQILARLQHANIARLLDGGVSDGGEPYFAMEYVDGTPLARHCDGARLSIGERLRLFLQVCDAVEYAHRNLVVHRDLKPSNILVTSEGQAKLLDFGIAKLLEPSAAGESLTVTRREARAMTPKYAAPEQLLGEPVTTATDVYSLGVVLYELLSGRSPYSLEGLGPAQVAQVVLEREPEPPSSAVRREEARDPLTPASQVASSRSVNVERLIRSVRGDLDNVAMMALRKEPGRRYPSVRALADDLRRFLDGLPVSARADTLAYRASKFARRHKVAVASALLLTLSLLGGVLGTLWQAREAVRQGRKAEEVKKFVLSLFAQSDPDAAKGKEITARQLLAQSAERIQSELAGQPEIEAEMLLFVGNIDHRLGLDRESRPLLERALELRRERLGDDSPAVAEAELALGSVCFSQGELERAEKLYESALATRLKRLGEDHPDAAFARGLLGRVRLDRGDLAGAEKLLRAAVADERRRLPAGHPELASNIDALGRVLHAKGDLDGADGLYREGLEMRRRLFGEEHTRVSESLLNVAAVMRDKGDARGAEPRYRQVLDLDRRLLGPSHERVAIDLSNLGLALIVKGDYAEAEGQLRESLEIRRRVHGIGSPKTAVAVHNLARVLRLQGRLNEAESLSRQALGLAIAMLGDEHGNVATVREELAQTLCGKGKLAEAESLARRALATYRQRLAPDHPWTSDGLVTLGHVLVAARKAGEAEALLQEAMRLRRARYGATDWRTAEAHLELGECLVALGRASDAGGHLSAGYRGLAGALGPQHPLALRAKLSAGRRSAPPRRNHRG